MGRSPRLPATTRRPARGAAGAGRAARSQRIAGSRVHPGDRLHVTLAEEVVEGGGVPALVLVGELPGPRVSLVGAPHGFEQAASLALDELARTIEPRLLRGTLVVVPVCRPRGRLARPGRVLSPLPLPGEPGGSTRRRLALALHAELVVAADALVVLTAPRPGRHAPLTARGQLEDLRVRRMAHASGAPVLLKLPRPDAPEGAPDASLLQVACAHDRPALELRTGSDDLRVDAARLAEALWSTLVHLGLLPGGTARPGRRASPLGRVTAVRAPETGRLFPSAPMGAAVRRGAELARIEPFGRAPITLHAPAAGILMEGAAVPFASRGQVVFLLGRSRTEAGVGGGHAGPRQRVGWVERVSLPALGLRSVEAKIDTGARTSALHVVSSRTIARSGASGRGGRLEIVLPGRGPRARRTFEVAVREHVAVRDTSGRQERRPVIETILEIGPLRRRIRLTLTNRGDMRYPLLVGRTALGGDVLVDPVGRFLAAASLYPQAPQAPGKKGR